MVLGLGVELPHIEAQGYDVVRIGIGSGKGTRSIARFIRSVPGEAVVQKTVVVVDPLLVEHAPFPLAIVQVAHAHAFTGVGSLDPQLPNLVRMIVVRAHSSLEPVRGVVAHGRRRHPTARVRLIAGLLVLALQLRVHGGSTEVVLLVLEEGSDRQPVLHHAVAVAGARPNGRMRAVRDRRPHLRLDVSFVLLAGHDGGVRVGYQHRQLARRARPLHMGGSRARHAAARGVLRLHRHGQGVARHTRVEHLLELRFLRVIRRRLAVIPLRHQLRKCVEVDGPHIALHVRVVARLLLDGCGEVGEANRLRTVIGRGQRHHGRSVAQAGDRERHVLAGVLDSHRGGGGARASVRGNVGVLHHQTARCFVHPDHRIRERFLGRGAGRGAAIVADHGVVAHARRLIGGGALGFVIRLRGVRGGRGRSEEAGPSVGVEHAGHLRRVGIELDDIVGVAHSLLHGERRDDTLLAGGVRRHVTFGRLRSRSGGRSNLVGPECFT